MLAVQAAVILRSRALARVAYPSRLAVKDGEHLRMTQCWFGYQQDLVARRTREPAGPATR
jgi:hypothetical protein